MKRIISMLLCLVMVLSMMPVSAFALDLGGAAAVGSEAAVEESAVQEEVPADMELIEELGSQAAIPEEELLEMESEMAQDGASWTGYSTYCWMTITGVDNLYSEPYTSSTVASDYPKSSKTYSFLANNIAINSGGNYWVRGTIYVDDEAVASGWVYGGHTTYSTPIASAFRSSAKLSATSVVQGTDISLSGQVYSPYYGAIKIYGVSVDILSGHGKSGTVKQSKTIMSKGSNAFDLSAMNDYLDFSQLAPGKYTIRVGAQFQMYYTDGTQWKVIVEPCAYANDYDACYYWYYYVTVTESDDYLSLCTSWPGHGTVTVVTAADMRTLPCSTSTNSKSTVVRKSEVGEELTITGLYRNHYGNYFYQVDLDGTTAYHYAADTKNGPALGTGITISSVTAPDTLTVGNSFSIGGKITSKYVPIIEVEVNVKDTDGNLILSSEEKLDGDYSYSLKNSVTDKGLKFGQLEVGDYTYIVWAKYRAWYFDGTDENYTEKWYKLYSKDFTVKNPSYKVTFNANGGSCSKASMTVVKTEKYGTLPTATREGYTFNGWYTAASGGTKITADSVVSISAAQTLYAQWTANSYAVSFDANGGSCATESKNVTYDGTYGELPTATRDGYAFDGWFTAASGGTKITADSTVSITAAQTLYAQWTAETVPAPAAPVISISCVATTGKPRLSWSAVDGAVKYEVWRAYSTNGTYYKMGSTTGTSYTNTGAKAGTTYYYKVRAVDANGQYSDYSSVKNMTCDCAQPVVSISCVTASGKPRLSWNSVDGAVRYEVWRAYSKNGTYYKMGSTTGTAYTNTSAKANTTYYYKVYAVGSSSYSKSAASSVVNMTCDCAQPVVSITTSTAGKPRLSWSAVEGAVRYEVWRAYSADGTYYKMGTTTGTTYTNTSAKTGTTYYFKVRAIGSSSYATSAYSSIVSAKCE